MAIQQYNPFQEMLLRESGIDDSQLTQLMENIGAGAMPLASKTGSGGILSFLKNQQTQAPTYNYGSYVIPASDPTYTSGFNYARTIAGGMPFEDVVAPGMSFSPEQPMGYTQADLNVVNLPRDVAPVFPTVQGTGQVARPSQPMMPYAPTGTPMPEKFIPSAQKFFPDVLPNFFGQIPQFDLSQIKLPEIDVSQFVTKEELPSFIPSIPSYEMPQIPQIDTSQFIGRQELPNILAGLPQAPQVDVSRFIGREELPSLLKDIPLNIPKIDTSKFVSREDISGLRSDILGSLPQVQMPDVSQFVTQQDINRAISGIPQISLSDIEARLAALESTPSIGVPKLPRPTGLFA